MDEEFWSAISVNCYWQPKPMTVGEYIEQSRSYLEGIRAIIPEYFGNFGLIRQGKRIPVEWNDKHGMTEAVIKCLPPWAYINEKQSDKKPHENSTCKSSYSATFYLEREKGKADISIAITTGGANDYRNFLNINIVKPEIDKESLLDLFKYGILFWNALAGAVGPNFMYKEFKNRDEIGVGWLTFLDIDANKISIRDIYSLEGINGGTIIRLSDDIPNMSNVITQSKVELVRSALKNYGVLKKNY